jgi:multisubunit Na+/H+ antiporter MnhE subunit
MSGVAIRALAFAGVYLLVLTSLKPGDVLAGLVLGVALALALRPRRSDGGGASPRLAALGPALWRTAVEMVRGSVSTARFCLGRGGAPGFVEIPRAGRSERAVALWGVLTGEAPDEVPVDVDEERDVLIVHLVDASDPEAVRARHRAAWEQARGGAGD